MRAVAVRAFHAVAEVMDLAVPQAGPGELLVRVEYAGMNPFDGKIADGLYEGRRPHVFPLVLGVDAAGVVAAVGNGTHRFREGDRVVGQFLHDPVGTGTYAEFTTVPEAIGVVRPPPELPSDRAAALPTAGMMALASVETLALAPGATLAVVGASGGVGSFATEMATARKWRVVALARPASAERLRSIGAEEVLDPTSPDVVASLSKSHPGGLDGVLDAMSDANGFARFAALVRPGGAAVSTTFAATPETLSRPGVRTVNLNLQPSAPLMERLVKEVVGGGLGIPLEARVRLADAPAALGELRSGRGKGKTVVDVSR